MEASRMLRLRLLGELRVERDGAVVALPASKRTRALLVYLAASANRHTRAQLCDLLWDGPDDPRAELRWSLTKLRPLHDKAHLAYVLNQLASHEDADARGSADLSVLARRTMTQALSPNIDSNDGSNGSAPSLARPSPTHAR